MNDNMVRQAAAGRAANVANNLGSTLFWRGIFAIVFGIAALFWPDASLKALIYLLGGYLVFDGIVSLVLALRVGTFGDYWLQIVTSIVAGGVVLAWPQATGKFLLIVLGIWALLSGISLFFAGRELKKEGEEDGLLTTIGLILIVIGVAVFFWQGFVTTAIAWSIGVIAILIGALLVFLGSRLKSLPDTLARTNDI